MAVQYEREADIKVMATGKFCQIKHNAPCLPPQEALSALLPRPGSFRHLSLSEPRKMPLMIPKPMHGYAERVVLHGLVYADIGKVRYWHIADGGR